MVVDDVVGVGEVGVGVEVVVECAHNVEVDVRVTSWFGIGPQDRPIEAPVDRPQVNRLRVGTATTSKPRPLRWPLLEGNVDIPMPFLTVAHADLLDVRHEAIETAL